MDSLQDMCIFYETFHTICGHVVTIMHHGEENCRNDNLNPFVEGIRLGLYFCKGYYFAKACIIYAKCSFCLDPHSHDGAINTFRSDGGDEPISPAEIRSRTVYWLRYINEQERLRLRQDTAELDHQEGYRLFTQCVQSALLGYMEAGDPLYDSVFRRMVLHDRIRLWYFSQQSLQLTQTRQMIPAADRLWHFHEPEVNPELLAPVPRASDAPADDDCGICREAMHDEEVYDRLHGVRRLWCGHVFHHDCIVGWFRHEGTCPACRSRRHLLRTPADFL